MKWTLLEFVIAVIALLAAFVVARQIADKAKAWGTPILAGDVLPVPIGFCRVDLTNAIGGQPPQRGVRTC